MEEHGRSAVRRMQDGHGQKRGKVSRVKSKNSTEASRSPFLPRSCGTGRVVRRVSHEPLFSVLCTHSLVVPLSLTSHRGNCRLCVCCLRTSFAALFHLLLLFPPAPTAMVTRTRRAAAAAAASVDDEGQLPHHQSTSSDDDEDDASEAEAQQQDDGEEEDEEREIKEGMFNTTVFSADGDWLPLKPLFQLHSTSSVVVIPDDARHKEIIEAHVTHLSRSSIAHYLQLLSWLSHDKQQLTTGRDIKAATDHFHAWVKEHEHCPLNIVRGCILASFWLNEQKELSDWFEQQQNMKRSPISIKNLAAIHVAVLANQHAFELLVRVLMIDDHWHSYEGIRKIAAHISKVYVVTSWRLGHNGALQMEVPERTTNVEMDDKHWPVLTRRWISSAEDAETRVWKRAFLSYSKTIKSLRLKKIGGVRQEQPEEDDDDEQEQEEDEDEDEEEAKQGQRNHHSSQQYKLCFENRSNLPG